MVMESAHKIVNWLHEWHHHRVDEEVNAEQFKSGSTQKFTISCLTSIRFCLVFIIFKAGWQFVYKKNQIESVEEVQ